MSQEECARLREGVPYVKVYRYNTKHLCLKLNCYGDNGQRSDESDDGNTASTSGGSSVSNAERYVQDRKSVREKKQPNWMTSGEFVCLVDDSQGDYYLNPISYTEAMQSN